jgi:shikimate kinase
MSTLQLSTWGDDKFVEEEGKALQQLKATKSIVSLTGSNPIHKEAMKHIREKSIVVYLNVPNQDILQRLENMKVNRIVGQSTQPMDVILEKRQQYYENDYDVRVVCPPGASPEDVANKVVQALNRLDNPTTFASTRGGDKITSFNETLLRGLASDGGLYVPTTELPVFDEGELELLTDMCYKDRALRVMEKLVHPEDIHPKELSIMVDRAYGSGKFVDDVVFPMVQIGTGTNQYMMEMFHGPTASFKDGSLQILPLLFQNAIDKTGSTDR